MIISGLFTMLSRAKDYYSEIPGRGIVEKMETIFERLNTPTPALQPVKATAERSVSPQHHLTHR